MQKNLYKTINIFLIYLLVVVVLQIAANIMGIVFRQYLRIANELIITIGLITILIIISKETQKKRIITKIITIIVIIFIFLGIFFQIIMGIDKEIVIQKDGKKKIEVESGGILYLEKSYYDYNNIFWYTDNPHYTEVYDDGDPNQLVYIDFYDSDGNLINRIFPNEKEDEKS